MPSYSSFIHSVLKHMLTLCYGFTNTQLELSLMHFGMHYRRPYSKIWALSLSSSVYPEQKLPWFSKLLTECFQITLLANLHHLAKSIHIIPETVTDTLFYLKLICLSAGELSVLPGLSYGTASTQNCRTVLI